MPRKPQVSRVIVTTDVEFTIIDLHNDELITLQESLVGKITDVKQIEKYLKKHYDNADTKFIKLTGVQVQPPRKYWFDLRTFIALANKENI